jgi:hypothetical protein
MSAYASATIGLAATAAAPGAGAVVTSVVAPDAGVYSARIIIELSGTAETQMVNLRLRVGGVATVTALPTTPGPAPTVVEVDRVVTNAANLAVDVQAIAAATAGSIYTVTLLLTRIS